jgi:myo-inositol catabolism protein IolC
MEAGARATLDKSHATACEKAQAVQTLIALDRVKSSELERFKQIVLDCANKCTTMEECEGMGDIGDRWGSSEITNAANTQIMVLLQSATDCDLAKKKGLSDYGNNACETTDEKK